MSSCTKSLINQFIQRCSRVLRLTAPTLFSGIERNSTDRKRYAEPDYDYLDRSARLEARRVRSVCDEWFLKYSYTERQDLRGRFQSPDEVPFVAAAFELYLHELLTRLGYKVTVHPETPTERNTKPDFLAVDADGYSFYVEAVVSSNMSNAERAEEARKAVVYDAIDRLDCPNFYLAMDVKGDLKTPPPGRRLRQELKRWVDGLDVDVVTNDLVSKGAHSLPKYAFKHTGWDVKFTAVPRSPEKRGRPGIRAIGSLSLGVRRLKTWQSIRNSVVAKGHRYGRLNKPLLVAVNVGEFNVHRIDIMQALFGQEQYIFGAGAGEPTMERAPNGVWYGRKGIQYTRVSAVLIAADVTPWTAAVRNTTLYHNPWATDPISGKICELSRAVLKNGRMLWVDGKHPREILDLPEGWPEVGRTCPMIRAIRSAMNALPR